MSPHMPLAIVLSLALPADLASEAPWQKIIGVVQDDTTPLGARCAALRLACNRADQEGAAQIVAVATGWLQQIDQSGLAAEQIARDPVLSPTRALIRALACDNGARLNATADAASLLNLWMLIATRPWTSRETKEAAFSLIAGNASPIAARGERQKTGTRQNFGIFVLAFVAPGRTIRARCG